MWGGGWTLVCVLGGGGGEEVKCVCVCVCVCVCILVEIEMCVYLSVCEGREKLCVSISV